jgi:hypothetical protein
MQSGRVTLKARQEAEARAISPTSQSFSPAVAHEEEKPMAVPALGKLWSS